LSLLLDTNALLWAVHEPQRLSPQAIAAIRTETSAVSLVSFWEIAIKQSIGKLDAGDGLESWVRAAGLEVVPIRSEHVWRTRDLPLLHRDPFDRMLVAQALIEGMTLVTSDRAFAEYGVSVIRA